MAKHVRIHPKDARRGFLVERYIYRGFKFEASRGWYSVSDEFAMELAECVQDTNSPVPVKIFQIASEQDAGKIEREDWEKDHPERKISESIKGAQVVPEDRLVPLTNKKVAAEVTKDLHEDEDENNLFS